MKISIEKHESYLLMGCEKRMVRVTDIDTGRNITITADTGIITVVELLQEVNRKS